MRSNDARLLAEECLAISHPQRWRHVQGVAARAAALSQSIDAEDPVVQAAWLHDVGYAPAAQDSGLHALDGARYLVGVGASPMVISLVAFHTGAEFEAEERGLAEELATVPRPDQSLLDALILCDLTVSPSGDPATVNSRLDEIVSRYSPADPVHRAVLRSRPYLEACCERAERLLSA
ncbi:HD domain-containing protein [Oryzobacter sp. R7]|uniref:HD domain-containing protein n=1 Tax=Oryzobacter faecalis TaxID=3388656 RepID=UPI00398C8AE1